MKIAVIGGASSYTPELVDGLFSRLDSIPVSELWMMDPHSERLAINAALCRRIAARHGDPFTIHTTADMREAVAGAKYVVTQIRVGGSSARVADEKLGLRHNIIGQETTGVGGFACALRTIPPILDVAHAMEELSPDGYLLNFTNPAGLISEAVIKQSSIKTIGLCNIPIGMIMDVVKHTGCAVEDVDLDYVGLNHLAWVRSFRVKGEDRTAELLEAFFANAEEEWEHEPIRVAMLEAMGSLGMFCNYYLQYFYATDASLAFLKSKPCTRGEEVIALEQSLFEKYQQPELNEKPEELSKRGGAHYSTAAFYLIDAIENDRGSRQIVSCRNDGAIPGFDDDVAVEVSAVIGAKGAKAIAQDAPHPAIRGLMQQIKAYESLTVEAAVTGDREAAYQALLVHPLMPGATECKSLLDDLLETNEEFLADTFYKETSLT